MILYGYDVLDIEGLFVFVSRIFKHFIYMIESRWVCLVNKCFLKDNILYASVTRKIISGFQISTDIEINFVFLYIGVSMQECCSLLFYIQL